MTARMPWWTHLWAAALIVWPAGCGNLLKSKFGQDQPPRTNTQKGYMEEAPEADSPAIQPETHLAAGRLHETQGRLVRAAEQYRLAIAAKPTSIEAMNRLGIVLDRLGRFKEADEVFAKAIRLAPDQAHLHNNLAFSYILQARWREAEVSLTKAIEIDPSMARARVNLAMTLAQQGRFDDAFTHFQAVLPIEDAHYNMGLMYQSKRLSVDAAKSFKAALRANPKLVAAQQRLDSLPKDVVSQAERNSEISASPPPAGSQLAGGAANLAPAPTSRPAIKEASAEPPAAEPLILDISTETASKDPETDEIEAADAFPRDD